MEPLSAHVTKLHGVAAVMVLIMTCARFCLLQILRNGPPAEEAHLRSYLRLRAGRHLAALLQPCGPRHPAHLPRRVQG